MAVATASDLRKFPVFIVEQYISAGSQFDGAAPTGSETADSDLGIRRFAASTAGGEFDFGHTQPLRVVGANLQLGDASSFTLTITDPVGGDTLWLSDTGASDVVLTEDDSIVLAPAQSLVLVTTGASQAMYARFLVQLMGQTYV